jgi:predicted ATPase
VLTRISIENFKSIKNAEVSLRPISIFCGPNASGKTNFAEAIDFLSHVFREGLQYAVAEKGGFYNISFRKVRRTKRAITFTVAGERPLSDSEMGRYEITFSIKALTEAIRAQFVVESEEYFFAVEGRSDSTLLAAMRISRVDEKYEIKTEERTPADFTRLFGTPSGASLKKVLEEIFKPQPQQLLLGTARNFSWSTLVGLRRIAGDLDGLRVFQINPRTARQPGTPSVERGMGRHGENLPVALDSFLSRRKLWRRLLTWTRDVVPSLGGWQTRYTETRQVGLFLQEQGFGAPWYSDDLSDGTIMSMALFMCLLEPTHRVVLIEEPENSLHPWALRRFLDRCREVSHERQIIITTHSPLVVSAAQPNELFLIERPKGETEITPAIERYPNLSAIIKKSALELGEFWLSGGIGAVPEPQEGVGEEAEKPVGEGDKSSDSDSQ